jgi:transposase
VAVEKVAATSGRIAAKRRHYSFRPDWCEAADPQSKGIVENPRRLCQAGPVRPQAPFTDLTVANAAARQWCAEINAVTHSEI